MKEYLSQRGQPFTERDIITDPQAIVELEKLGYLTTPVEVVDGEVVVGFNRVQLDNLLS